ncbi:MAG: transposase [Bacteroidota bacterium]
MDKYKGKYRIDSTRAPFWDYRSESAYFVTICTKNRIHFFGEISDGKMILSDIGKIVESEWLKTFDMRPDMNLGMGEFVVMPNHFHAVISIGKNEYNSPGKAQCIPDVETQCIASPHQEESPKNKFGPQSKNLASIIRGFKTGVTVNARALGQNNVLPVFAWQSRYHDHIIRNEKELDRISNYIRNNPAKWEQDRLKHQAK